MSSARNNLSVTKVTQNESTCSLLAVLFCDALTSAGLRGVGSPGYDDSQSYISRDWKEMHVKYLKLLPRYSLKNPRKPSVRKASPRPGLESGTSRRRVRRVTAVPTHSVENEVSSTIMPSL
jgi:hypothetical protein